MTGSLGAVKWAAVAVMGLGVLAVVLRLAWISDDAYITLRSVEHLLRGHGPVWNVGERVQTFTHPLWFWLLVGTRALTGEHYFTTIALAVALTMLAVLLLARRAGPVAGVALLAALIACRVFGDYATSGLETPLVMLLLVLLAHADDCGDRQSRFGLVALLSGLLMTTRLDTALIALPVLLGHLPGKPLLRRLPAVGLGFAPLIAWTAFAIAYYGSPFPITAYAKAFAPGVPAVELWAQGWRYVEHTLVHDPVAVLLIALGMLVGGLWWSLRGRMLALGALLSCLYVVKVGGDFMAGRFFLPALVVAVCLLGRALRRLPRTSAVFAAAMMAAAWVPGLPPFLRGPSHDVVETPAVHGIKDERRSYYRHFGLFSPEREIPVFGRFTAALQRQGRDRTVVLGSGMAGGIPFVAGEQFYFIDSWLCDPLLMRLPVADPTDWRIGHFTRAIPDGYPESVAFGSNRVRDDQLHQYYDQLRAVIRGPLWTKRRLSSLFGLLAGGLSAQREAYVDGDYRKPPRRLVNASQLSQRQPAVGAFWFDDDRILCVGRGGLRVQFDAIAAAGTVRLSATQLVRYRMRFFAGDSLVGEHDLLGYVGIGNPPSEADADLLGYLQRLVGLHNFEAALPADLPPFDAVEIECDHEPWIQPAIGSLRFDR